MKPLEYTEVKAHLIGAIESGRLEPNSKLPSERELTDAFHVNRNTVRHALNQLESEGYIYRSSRRGWFAKSARLIYNPADHVNFSQLVTNQGRDPSWEIIATETFFADAHLAAKFKLIPGDPLYLDREVGSIDGLKVYYAVTYFNAHLCPGILPKIVAGSITSVLKDDYNIIPQQTELLIRPIRLDKEAQKYLGLQTGAPGLYIRRIKATQQGEIVEIDNEYWRYDALEIRVDTL